MELRAEQYEQIIAQLPSEFVDRRRAAERRAAPRVGLRAQIQLIPCRAGAPAKVLPASLRDISHDGIGLILNQALDPGILVVLSLPGSGSRTLELLFHIVRCTPLSNGQFSVGASFRRLVRPDDLKQQPRSSTRAAR
jgi:PilZ domain-containing protein